MASNAYKSFFSLDPNAQTSDAPPVRGPRRPYEYFDFEEQYQPPPMTADDVSVDNKNEYINRYRKIQNEEFARHFSMPKNAATVSCGASIGLSAMEKLTLDGVSQIVSNAPPDKPSGSKDVLSRVPFLQPQEHQQSKNLPILAEREDIMDYINSNTVTIVSGATGCGKTTMIPQFILSNHKDRKLDVKIIVTQPRRLAAQSIARRVADSMNVRLGSLVGYKVGMDREHVSPDTLLLYCTTGVLKKMLINKRCLSEYTHVILDEVHDREEDMDFLLLLCKKFINTNSRGVKLILMSATLNTQKLKEYFEWSLPGSPYGGEAACVEIPQMNRFKISVFYSNHLDTKRFHTDTRPEAFEPRLHPEQVENCVKILKEFHKSDTDEKNPGAVLVFLPGEAEIVRVKTEIEKAKEKWWILVLHSRIPVEDSQEVFRSRPGFRKIILSTNIAESSVTIPDINYVIDFCLTKNVVCDQETNYVRLKLEWADKKSLKQRRGRCGRTCDGRVYRLIHEDFYRNVIIDEHPPEMLRAPLDKVILDTKQLDFGPPKEILALAMDPPDLQNITSTIMILKEVGALLTTVNGVDVEDDGDLTVLGEVVSNLPIDIRLGKLVVLGFLFGVLDEAVIIAAGLSAKSIFATPFQEKLKAYSHKLLWADRTFSDCVAVYKAYTVWKEKKTSRFFDRQVGSRGHLEANWCRSRFLQLKALREMDDMILEIKNGLKRIQMVQPEVPNESREIDQGQKMLMIQVAIFGAFYPNYMTRDHGPAGTVDMREAYKGLAGRPLTSTIALGGMNQTQIQCGELYVKQIKELFADPCECALDAIKINFESYKVLVTFDVPRTARADPNIDNQILGQRNLTGDILHHVYIALKMRQLPRDVVNKMLTIQVYPETLAMEVMEDILKKESQERPATPERATHEDAIGRVKPPVDKYDILTVDITHIENPSSIWVNYQKDSGMVETMLDTIEAITKPETIDHWKKVESWRDLRVKQVYLAPFDDGYYRARLDKFKDCNLAKIFFIDFGNSETIDPKSMIVIDEEMIEKFPQLVKIPALALHCSLANVKPNPVRSECSSGEWDEEATLRFKTLFPNEGSGDSVWARVISVLPQDSGLVTNVKIYVVKTVTVNEQFLQEIDQHGKHFAESSIEDDFCLSTFGNYSLDTNKLKELHKLNLTKACLTVTLKPPSHPLEVQVYSINRIGTGKKVKIEGDSVNSVFLDRFPDSPITQWIVAARVDLNPSGNLLLARATTLMPHRAGLGPILVMCFAPKVELRCDKNNNFYTGCLTGLGWRQRGWGKPSVLNAEDAPKHVSYFPEHDIELEFDVCFDNHDIDNINNIRFLISKALSRATKSRSPSGQLLPLSKRKEFPFRFTIREELIDCQKKLRASFEQLLSKERLRKSKEICKTSYLWKQQRVGIIPCELAESADYILRTFPSLELNYCEMRRLENKLIAFHKIQRNIRNGTPLDAPLCCPLCSKTLPMSEVALKQHIIMLDHENLLKPTIVQTIEKLRQKIPEIRK